MRRFHQALPPQVRRWRIPIALGITVATLAWVAVALGRRGNPTELPSVPVVIARTSIPAHTVLRPEVIAAWNSRTPVPEGAFTDPRDVQGLLAMRDLKPGEVITRDAAAPPEKVFGAAALVPPGMRAVTIVLQGSQGFDGRLTRGAFVDVIAVTARSQLPEARTVLTRARVLHVKSSLSQGQGTLAGVPGTGGVEVTLAVPPELTPPLALAQAHGQLMLALHSAADGPSPETAKGPVASASSRGTHQRRSVPKRLPPRGPERQERQQVATPQGNVNPPPGPSQPIAVQDHGPLAIELILGEQRTAVPLHRSAPEGGKEP